jgi:arginyl-tRNA synthetase
MLSDQVPKEAMSQDHLATINTERLGEAAKRRDEVQALRAQDSAPAFLDYPLPQLQERIRQRVRATFDDETLDVRIDLIERAKFHADLTVKVPGLLKRGGPKVFIADHLPRLVQVLSEGEFGDVFSEVTATGIYANLRLSDEWLIRAVSTIAGFDGIYGTQNALAEHAFVVDYSSPNAAKRLHAGHIRSTIIGHILSNLYDASGGTVYRVNHINDFGGFGYTLQGYRQFAAQFPAAMAENDRLIEIYQIRRALERVAGDGKDVADWDPADAAVLRRYLPEVTDLAGAQAAAAQFTADSDRRFAALEAGDEDEVQLWQDLVAVSLASFDEFYNQLGISFDFVLGESLYLQAGTEVVERALLDGTAVIYTQELADRDLAGLREQADEGTLSAQEYESQARAVAKDVGATVVPLDKGERYVVRRADGRSIYATRDIGAVAIRSDLFGATDLIYVVGQEQRVHFDRLFRAAARLGLIKDGVPRTRHVYFGFYVDATSGKKLSSRDSVSNVMGLLAGAFDYFRASLSDRIEGGEDEIAAAARALAVGSLVFNDLKKDLRSAVEIDSHDIQRTITEFERSGGAYVIYAAVRARSILRRVSDRGLTVEPAGNEPLDDQEALLALRLLTLPDQIVAAAEESNPSVLVRHMLDIANIYSSYYSRAHVISDDVVNGVRYSLTQATASALTSALAICHIEVPAAI